MEKEIKLLKKEMRDLSGLPTFFVDEHETMIEYSIYVVEHLSQLIVNDILPYNCILYLYEDFLYEKERWCHYDSMESLDEFFNDKIFQVFTEALIYEAYEVLANLKVWLKIKYELTQL